MRFALLAALLMLAGAGEAPKPQAEIFAPGVISGDQYDSHPSFSPDGKILLFVRSDRNFANWRIWQSERTSKGWSAPHPASFAAGAIAADPCFSSDGRRVYFISTKTAPDKTGHDLDIWVVSRTGNGWGTPERLPAPINSPGAEWFPRLQRDGKLYFGSDRPGGLGGTDIYRARKTSSGWEVTNLGSPVNSSGDEYEFEPSANAKYAILMADRPPSDNGDLYLVRARKAGWAAPKRLGSTVNTDALEVGPFLSRDGEYLFFSSRRSDSQLGDIYRASTSILKE